MWACSRRGLASRTVTSPLVGSYPTISPLPGHGPPSLRLLSSARWVAVASPPPRARGPGKTAPGGMFLCHFPYGHPSRPLAGVVPHVCPSGVGHRPSSRFGVRTFLERPGRSQVSRDRPTHSPQAVYHNHRPRTCDSSLALAHELGLAVFQPSPAHVRFLAAQTRCVPVRFTGPVGPGHNLPDVAPLSPTCPGPRHILRRTWRPSWRACRTWGTPPSRWTRGWAPPDG